MRLRRGEVLILASASPRRRELLSSAGIPLVCRTAEVDESRWKKLDLSPKELVGELSLAKADVVAQENPGRLVLGADTVVVLDGKILGKPADLEEAWRFFRSLSGREHSVLTGVSLVRGRRRFTFVVESRVLFRRLTEETIRAYFAAVNPLDKAGGYGLQEHGDWIVERVEGSQTNVVGLPLGEVMQALHPVSAWRYGVGRVVAFLFLVLLFPWMVLIGLRIWLFRHGSVLYLAERLGERGRSFRVWKFRTMRKGADAELPTLLQGEENRREWMAHQKLADDPRVVGGFARWLRKTGLDELPQLWNVVRGEMALVGPRPIVRQEVARYGLLYDVLASVRPGITGLWQVSGRSRLSYEQRVQLDCQYVREATAWTDLKILLMTPTVWK